MNPETDLKLERIVDLPAEKIWEAWTNPKHYPHFFCPKPWKTSHAEIEVRPGGKFHTVMESPEGEKFPSTGCILEAIPNRKLVFTDTMGPDYRPNANPFMTAVITLEPLADGKTKYTAIALHKDAETKQKHEEMGFTQGWGIVVDQLVEYMKSL